MSTIAEQDPVPTEAAETSARRPRSPEQVLAPSAHLPGYFLG